VRILLDECLPRQLAKELPEHEVITVQKAGWPGTKNGQLLKKMSGRFEVFLTIDKRLAHEQEIPTDVAVITVRARSNRIQDLRPLVPELRRIIAEAKPGLSTSAGRITRR
jgi:predicted nuclease of predicted toxin-antitoxin system